MNQPTAKTELEVFAEKTEPPTMIGLDTNLSRVLAKEYVKRYGKRRPNGNER